MPQIARTYASTIASVRFGADPELMLVKEEDGSSCVPAWDVTKGTKKEHEKITPSIDIHADGVALEFNLKASNAHNFASSITAAMIHINAWAKKRKVKALVQAEGGGFDAQALQHPMALTSGCDPDFCAYDEIVGTPRTPLNLSQLPFRYFGGHIHVGYDKDIVPPWVLIRAMDALWYLRAIQFDLQKTRRGFYGKAGIYREKPYGVEYRTPSSFWLTNTGVTLEFAQNISTFLGKVGTETKQVHKWFQDRPWKEIREAIDSENIAECLKLHTDVVSSLSDIMDFYNGY